MQPCVKMDASTLQQAAQYADAFEVLQFNLEVNLPRGILLGGFSRGGKRFEAITVPIQTDVMQTMIEEQMETIRKWFAEHGLTLIE